MSEDDTEGSFQVRDRRHFTAEGDRREAEEASEAEAAAPAPPPAPPAAEAAGGRPPAPPEPAPPPPEPVPEARKPSIKERLFGRKSPGEEPPFEAAGAEAPGAEIPDEQAISFSNFVLSLMTQVLMHLGEIVNPVTQQPEPDLGLAKQTIDLIAMLEAKTRGNLTRDEEALISQVLYDLRMRYVDRSRGAP